MNEETKKETQGAAGEQQQASGPVFRMENILIKNLSLETPGKTPSPSLGNNPTVKMEIRNAVQSLTQENYYEVTLEVTCRLFDGEEVQILVEASQAGIVFLDQADARQREIALNIHTPEILYPYLCQLVGDLLTRAGAPRLFLPPVNFRALYERTKRAQEKKLREKEEDEKSKVVS